MNLPEQIMVSRESFTSLIKLLHEADYQKRYKYPSPFYLEQQIDETKKLIEKEFPELMK